MVNVLNILKAVVSLIPLLIEAVKKVEEAIPESGVGKQKLDLIKSILEAAFSTAGDVVVRFEQIWPILVNVVASAVSIFNSKGIFKKTDAV